MKICIKAKKSYIDDVGMYKAEEPYAYIGSYRVLIVVPMNFKQRSRMFGAID